MKIILLLTMLVFGLTASAQAVFEIKSPSNIKGFYNFGFGDSTIHYWGNGNTAKKNITADLALATGADSLAGTALTGNYSGKIAVVYRGTYAFSLKALNAQNAGAVAVIIINHGKQQDGSVNATEIFNLTGFQANETSANATGLKVTIPVLLIGKADGDKIAAELRAKNTVTGYIGKKLTFANDLKLDKNKVFAPRVRTKVTALSQEGDISEVFGLQVKNSGDNEQFIFRAKVKVEFENKVIHRDSVIWFDDSLKLKAHDSTGFFTFKNKFAPTFDLKAGEYKVTYSVNFVDTTNIANITNPADFKDAMDIEQFGTDNIYSYTFNVADSVYAIATISSYTDNGYTKQTYKNVPDWTSPAYLKSEYYAAQGYEQATCIVLSDKNANRIQADGIVFSAFNKEMKTIKDQLVKINVYEWADNFTDMGDTVNFGFKSLIPLVDNQEYIIKDTSVWNYQNVKFDDPVKFEASKRYLACIHSKDSVLAFGFDKGSVSMLGGYMVDYQPTCPMFLNGNYYRIGWGYTYTPSVAFNVSPQKKTGGVGINELNADASLKVYPNPASASLNVAFDLENASEVLVTVSDLSGKVVYSSKSLKGSEGTNIMTIDTRAMNNGMYVLNVISNNSVVSKKFNVMQ